MSNDPPKMEIVQQNALNGLRVIAFAFKELEMNED